MKKGKVILSAIIGMGVGASASGYVLSREVKKKNEKVEKFRSYYNVLNQWLSLKQENKNLSQYFSNNNFKKIAIYGMGEMGTRLYSELENSDIEVVCAIDKNASNTFTELNVIEPDDELPEVDAIVVTAVFAFDDIESMLSEKANCTIVSLEDVVFEM